MKISKDKDFPQKKKASFDRDWTEGSIVGNLWGLSWPMTVTALIEQLGIIIDMVWVGRLGASAMASVGVAGLAVMMMVAARQGLNTGIRAMLARFVGAKDFAGANLVTQQAMIVSGIFAIAVAVIGIFFSDALLTLLGVEPHVVARGGSYMRIQLVGSFFMSFAMLARGIMQASGDAVTPMKLSIATRVLHLCLSPFLIFGWWIFPRLEVNGAAVTTLIAEGVIGAGIGLWIIFSGRTRIKPTLKNLRIDGHLIWRMIRIGIPAALTGMERSFANLLIVWFIAPFGTLAVAAHSLLQRIDICIHMPASGVGQAAGVLAGQNLGAGRPDRAEKTGWTAAGLFTLVMMVIAVIVWFQAENIVRIFNTEPGLVQTAANFLRIQIGDYLVFGLVVVLMYCLNGAGDTLVPMLTTLATMWFIQVPLAYLIPKWTDLGVYGVRWAGVIAIILRGLIYAVYFKAGFWKRRQL
ncbi:MAG: MATE family efflux transporter [Deltaproteobacteria bacterium]|nr:MATE family efflux transporter [Deltaproteobacteria bacterium]